MFETVAFRTIFEKKKMGSYSAAVLWPGVRRVGGTAARGCMPTSNADALLYVPAASPRRAQVVCVAHVCGMFMTSGDGYRSYIEPHFP